ncbi:MAG TPA: hypothetical protein VMT82_00285 [candidate division Zixibacteria bacterium]|nr:hypothetical protein [candidate division Zixibacteria bacterium]
MSRPTEERLEAITIPLDRATLCVDCEIVSSSRSECPVCGSDSMVSLSHIMGGSLVSEESYSPPSPNTTRFDVEMNISVQDLPAKDVDATVKVITDLIRQSLERSRAKFHIHLEPATDVDVKKSKQAA